MSQEIATPTAPAVNPESAPETPVVETPAATATVEAASPEQVMETPEGAEPATAEEGDKPSKLVKEVIGLRKRSQKAELEVAYLRGLVEGKGGPSNPNPEPVAPAVPAPPKLDDFETYEDYERAREDFLLWQAEQRVLTKIQNQQKEQQERDQQFTAKQRFEQRIEKAAETDPAIYEIMGDPTLPVSPHMVPILQNSEMAPQLLRWLDANRADATRIASLPPVLAAHELGKVEAKLALTPKPEPPRRVSAAPEPIQTVQPVGTPIVQEKDLPIDEWMARRNKAQFSRK